jgi:hypothetical protein
MFGFSEIGFGLEMYNFKVFPFRVQTIGPTLNLPTGIDIKNCPTLDKPVTYACSCFNSAIRFTLVCERKRILEEFWLKSRQQINKMGDRFDSQGEFR